jgi:transposase
MRPRQRFVALRSSDNQVAVMRHRVREQLVGQRTALVNRCAGISARSGSWRPKALSTPID